MIVVSRRIPYDYLVIAIGSKSNDFNTKGVAENCIFLDNPAQAMRFQQKMLELFLKLRENQALDDIGEEESKQQLAEDGHINIAIVGAGATGVELSAELYNAEILKQKQELSLVEAGEFNSLGKRSDRVYFVETFDTESGIMKNLFLRELDKNGNDNIIFAKEGNFALTDNKRTLELRNGYRYSGKPGRADYNQVSFEHLSMIISTTPKIVDPIAHRRTIPTAKLFGSDNPQYQAELMWRLSLPISVLLLSMLAVPLSYFNPRTGHTYNILIAIGMFLIYQNGLTFLRDAVEDGKIHFWFGMLPMHILMIVIAVVLLRVRSMPAQPFWQAVGKSLTLKGGK